MLTNIQNSFTFRLRG